MNIQCWDVTSLVTMVTVKPTHVLHFSPPAEVVELSKDVHLREVKWSLIRVVLQDLLGPLEAKLILVIETNAVCYSLQYNRLLQVPYFVVATVCDVSSASRDHLVGHFDKESRHPLRRVVVA